ncbi:CaiB/BaiF CoA transferase family protein [Chloroflexota bacterium]
MARKIFEGLKVVECGNLVSASYCTKLLGDLGAQVIKIEKPHSGDEARSHGPFPDDVPDIEQSGLFLVLNTNKLGITLNLDTPKGRDILKRLLADADVFVENNSPQYMRERGLDYDSLEKTCPNLVMASITPFGQSGSYRDYKAYDINCSAAGGVSIGIGDPEREPLALPLSQGGYQAGATTATAVVLALLARKKIGRGQHIDLSEVENWGSLHTGPNILTFLYRGVTGVRRGTHGGYFLYPNEILPCKDGYISIQCVQLEQWTRLLELMGNPEWAENPRYRDRRAMHEEYPDEANAHWIPWLKEHTAEELFQMIRAKRIPFAPVYPINLILEHPHLQEGDFWVEVEHPKAGRLRYPRGACKYSRSAWQIERAAPLLGEHNELILGERLGYSKEELANLKKDEVI